MHRSIVGFEQDEAADWTAILDCGHRQHVRHNPPLVSRPWVVTEAGRRSRLGQPLDCVRCDRFEMPPQLEPYRKSPAFAEDPQLQRVAHGIARNLFDGHHQRFAEFVADDSGVAAVADLPSTTPAMKGPTMNPTHDALEISGLATMEAPDQPLIARTLERLLVGFARRDAEMLHGVYTDDADWVNAFGSVKRGGPEIVDYLRGLFADTNFNDGKPVAPPVCRLRRLGRDHAVVSCHLQIAGQGLVGGGSIMLRDNRSLHVLARQADASWRIVSAMFMDARRDQSYVNHS